MVIFIDDNFSGSSRMEVCVCVCVCVCVWQFAVFIGVLISHYCDYFMLFNSQLQILLSMFCLKEMNEGEEIN